MSNSKLLKVLILDDDPAITQILFRILEGSFGDQLQFHVQNDAQQALVWIHKNLPDVILSDLQMPAVSGLDIIEQSRQRNPLTQVIMLTGHASTMSLLAALAAGGSHYLLKPVVKEAVVLVVQQTTERVRRWKTALVGAMQQRWDLAEA